METYRNSAGELHREDGPARIWSSGTREWYINGKLHREDGPAVILYYGTEFFYINGKKLTNEEIELYKFVNKL